MTTACSQHHDDTTARRNHQRPLPPPPQPDPTCSTCLSPNTTLYRHHPEAKSYLEGEIIGIRESVHRPIDHIFGLTIPSMAPLLDGRGIGKVRPAIVWDDDGPTASLESESADLDPTIPTTTRACLMASYEGNYALDTLPQILRDNFAVPISPHCGIREGTPHLHTSPEWQKDHTWLIVYPFTSLGVVDGRWLHRALGGRKQKEHSFKVEESMLDMLYDLCQEKMDRWSQRCLEEEDYITQCLEDYGSFRLDHKTTKTGTASNVSRSRTTPTADVVSPVPSTPEQSGQASQGPGGVRIDSQVSPRSGGPSQEHPQSTASRTGKRRGRNSRYAKSHPGSIPSLNNNIQITSTNPRASQLGGLSQSVSGFPSSNTMQVVSDERECAQSASQEHFMYLVTPPEQEQEQEP
ncbi:hypothetical protein C8Q74DRAFT_1234487 [Fomes fomentarius]|nr:hypothetical protein C8Q74DRAFT_1234487 [Fomes fomentarius]